MCLIKTIFYKSFLLPTGLDMSKLFVIFSVFKNTHLLLCLLNNISLQNIEISITITI